MAIDSPARTVDAVTRLCYYQGAAPSTWLRFVRQVADTAQDLERDATESLLSLLSETETAPPTLASFLSESLQSSPPLVRPSFLAKYLLGSTSASLPLPTLENIFCLINVSQGQDPTIDPYLASTPEETAQGLVDLIDNIVPRLPSAPFAPLNNSPDSEIVRWVVNFLHAQASVLSATTLKDATLRSACTTKVERFLDSTLASTVGKLFAAPLTSILMKLQFEGNKRRPMPRLCGPIGRPDLELFVATLVSLLLSSVCHHVHSAHPSETLIQYSTSPRTIRNDLSERLSSILAFREQQGHFLSTSVEEAAVSGLFDLFDAVVEGCQSAKSIRAGHVTRSILGVQLPRIVRKVVERDERLRECVAQAIARFDMKGSKSEMDLEEDARKSGARDLVAGLCREGLLTEDAALSFDQAMHKSQLQPTSTLSDISSRLASHDGDEIKQVLAVLPVELSTQGVLSSSVCETMTAHAQSSDLDALSIFCDALIQDPATLEIVFVHEEPRKLLAPIRETLDSFDTAQDNFGESNLIERYGNLVVFIQVVVHRFELADNLGYHLGSSQSFLSSWIPSSSAAYTLSSLGEEGRTAVAGFIAALFGDGISDDLMHATNPRTLLRIAPTILKQSLVACQNGIVDLDSVKDALSYFLQELLSFTLPGVLQWLIGEIERTPLSPAQSAMFDILQVILFAESLPRTVLELVSMDLARLISSASFPASSAASPFDTNRAKGLVVGFLKKPRRLQTAKTSASESWSDVLRSHLAALVQNSSSPEASLEAALVQHALSHLGLERSPDKVALQILSHLLALVPTLPTPPPRVLRQDQEAPYGLRIRLERVGAAIFSGSPPLFHSLVNHLLPSYLSSRSDGVSAGDGFDQTEVEMVSDIVGGTFTLALSTTDERARAEAVLHLERLAHVCKRTLAQGDGVAREEGLDRPTLARVFVDRLTSYESLLKSSNTLSVLSTRPLS
ncbi:hypothetical protein JCM11491_001479 [Sporobolomyces phaffii]